MRIDPAQIKQMKADGMAPCAIAKTLRIGRDSVYRALTNWGPDSLNPPYKNGDEADTDQVIPRQPVVSSGDAPEVLQPVECALDAPAQLVET
jgi:hypothetical protein